MKSLILLITITLFSLDTVAQEITTDPKVVQTIKNKGLVLYKQLTLIKTNPEFLANGLSDSKSKEWNSSVRSLSSECGNEIKKLPKHLRSSSELSILCKATNNLQKTGEHYAKHRSNDNDFTSAVKTKVESAFGVNR